MNGLRCRVAGITGMVRRVVTQQAHSRSADSLQFKARATSQMPVMRCRGAWCTIHTRNRVRGLRCREAVTGLNLGPYGNTASRFQVVTSINRSIVLEAGVRNGGAGVRQTLVSQKSAFSFGPGSTYP